MTRSNAQLVLPLHPGPHARDTFRRTLEAAGRNARYWYQLARQRRQLAQLDARMLDDAGIPGVAASRESRRPFWDLPVGPDGFRPGS